MQLKKPKKNTSKNKEAVSAKEKRQTEYQKAVRKRKIVNTIMGFIVFCGLLGCLSGFSLISTIIKKSDVILNTDDLNSADSSIIYDANGEQITLIGEESRISVSYNKIPQVVIDAFIAIEDSRYFEHSGFDLPRFAKAILENLSTLSFSQGGSTITMQVIKKSYFEVDTIAERDSEGGIPRKVQEIFFSLKINQIVSKEKILELYLNKINYGASARGIQVASQYYFGKNCTELSLVEAAMLAGVINAPNSNNPYNNLQNCYVRTHDVLYLMYYHGYITESEYNLALKVKIENLLVGTKTHTYGQGETIDYQSYIDVVLSELEDVYGIDAYTTPVKVYTGMNKEIQHYCDEFSRGNLFTWQDDKINGALVLMQNYTGLIVGLSGGRDYDSYRIYNYAYDARINPGSTAKAIFTYPLAFEYCGLGTNYYTADEPIYWQGTNIMINEDGGYYGEASVQRAFTQSYNITAVKMYRWTAQMAGYAVQQAYLKSIGMDYFTYSNLNEQYAIGAQNFVASPIQVCAAESVILSRGQYSVPHTITRIEYINSTEEPIIVNPTTTQVLSEGAAWLTSYLERINVNGGSTSSDWLSSGRLEALKRNRYTVYGKTGTTLYDTKIRNKYGMAYYAPKDCLLVGGTNDYSFCIWYGYDTGKGIDSTTYVKLSTIRSHFDCKVITGLLDTAYNEFGAPRHTNNQPSSVTSLTHLKGVYPYTEVPSFASAEFATTSLILSKYAELKPYEATSTIESITSFSAEYNQEEETIDITWGMYPDFEATQIASEKLIMKDKKDKEYEGVRAFDKTWIEGAVNYYVDIVNGETGEIVSRHFDTNTVQIPVTNDTGHDVQYILRGYYRYTIIDVQSNIKEVTIKVKPTKAVEPEEPEEPIVNPEDPSSEVTE